MFCGVLQQVDQRQQIDPGRAGLLLGLLRGCLGMLPSCSFLFSAGGGQLEGFQVVRAEVRSLGCGAGAPVSRAQPSSGPSVDGLPSVQRGNHL